jgi:hypothetical protein
VVKDDTKPAGYQLALITTDLTSTPAQIVERYADRWAIEVRFAVIDAPMRWASWVSWHSGVPWQNSL